MKAVTAHKHIQFSARGRHFCICTIICRPAAENHTAAGRDYSCHFIQQPAKTFPVHMAGGIAQLHKGYPVSVKRRVTCQQGCQAGFVYICKNIVYIACHRYTCPCETGLFVHGNVQRIDFKNFHFLCPVRLLICKAVIPGINQQILFCPHYHGSFQTAQGKGDMADGFTRHSSVYLPCKIFLFAVGRHISRHTVHYTAVPVLHFFICKIFPAHCIFHHFHTFPAVTGQGKGRGNISVVHIIPPLYI